MRGGRGLGWAGCVLGVWLVACGGTSTETTLRERSGSICQPMTCASQGLDCGVAIDGCGGTLHCGTCASGEVCGGAGVPNVCGPPPCQPTTCAALGRTCGRAPDGCGGTLECGTCKAPETCGGAGVPGVCGPPACTPSTCASLGKNCGSASDGCGGTLVCGTCPAGQTCGGGGAPNVCGRAPCRPTTCAELGRNCGTVSDGCEGTLECGTCAAPEVCGGGGVPHVCGVPPCTPATCASLGAECGPVPDGCGGMLECGTCPEGQTCGGGGAPHVCGQAGCTPATCASLGVQCGPVPDGCGGTLECGTCPEGQTCGGGGLSGVCGSGACTPATCASLGAQCGPVPDGCGGTLECGTCPEGETCGGGGVAHVCGVAVCRPYSCGLLQKNCGAVPDGCGGMRECGTCAAPETCGASGTPNVCYTPASVCVDQELGSALPVTVRGTTAFANDDHHASCGGEGALDRGLRWTAPRTGVYTFDTARSAFRSLLAVRLGGCGGAEVACASDGISYGGGARVTAALEAGQTVLVVVDSPGTSALFGSGHFELHIDELRQSEAGACFDGTDNDGDRWVDCADTDCHGEPGCGGRGCAHHDLGSALPTTFHGETVESGDGFQGTCGAKLQQDRAHLWTAPRSGTFVFDTSPGGWGNALYVLTGCRGTELACDASRAGSATDSAAVKVELKQGQTVLVVVDGMAGEDAERPIRYTLHVSEYAPTEAGRCRDGADNDADGSADSADSDCI